MKATTNPEPKKNSQFYLREEAVNLALRSTPLVRKSSVGALANAYSKARGSPRADIVASFNSASHVKRSEVIKRHMGVHSASSFSHWTHLQRDLRIVMNSYHHRICKRKKTKRKQKCAQIHKTPRTLCAWTLLTRYA